MTENSNLELALHLASAMRTRANLIEKALRDELEVTVFEDGLSRNLDDIHTECVVVTKSAQVTGVRFTARMMVGSLRRLSNPHVSITADNGNLIMDSVSRSLTGEHGPVMEAVLVLPMDPNSAPKVTIGTIDTRS